MSQSEQGDTDTTGELNADLVQARKVQDGDGCLRVTIPKDGADDLGISAGDGVLFSGKEGDRALSLQPATSLFGDGD